MRKKLKKIIYVGNLAVYFILNLGNVAQGKPLNDGHICFIPVWKARIPVPSAPIPPLLFL